MVFAAAKRKTAPSPPRMAPWSEVQEMSLLRLVGLIRFMNCYVCHSGLLALWLRGLELVGISAVGGPDLMKLATRIRARKRNRRRSALEPLLGRILAPRRQNHGRRTRVLIAELENHMLRADVI